jgi:hypothetical protein
MSTIKPLLTGPRSQDRPADQLDDLLHNFLRGELPEPWPTWKPPAETAPRTSSPPSQGNWVNRGRWVLAASLLLLLAGQLCLSHFFSDQALPPSQRGLNQNEATNRTGEPKPKEVKATPRPTPPFQGWSR